MKPRQEHTTTKEEMRVLSTHYRENGEFAIIHDHRPSYGCPGDCLMLNLPDEVRSELSDEV